MLLPHGSSHCELERESDRNVEQTQLRERSKKSNPKETNINYIYAFSVGWKLGDDSQMEDNATNMPLCLSNTNIPFMKGSIYKYRLLSRERVLFAILDSFPYSFHSSFGTCHFIDPFLGLQHIAITMAIPRKKIFLSLLSPFDCTDKSIMVTSLRHIAHLNLWN